MAVDLAQTAVQIVILLSSGSFQAMLPQLSPTASPAFPDTKEGGQAFIDWLVSPDGQKAIADYKIGGEQLFFPNAGH
jgi:ABC-type tungstate transport system permease subunit